MRTALAILTGALLIYGAATQTNFEESQARLAQSAQADLRVSAD